MKIMRKPQRLEMKFQKENRKLKFQLFDNLIANNQLKNQVQILEIILKQIIFDLF